jgi:hypothetical protein
MTVVDIKTRKPLERIETEEDLSVSQFMSLMKKYAKDEKVRSVFMLTISEDNDCNWGMVTASEYHLLLAYATLDDLKDEIRDAIFPQPELDFDEDE